MVRKRIIADGTEKDRSRTVALSFAPRHRTQAAADMSLTAQDAKPVYRAYLDGVDVPNSVMPDIERVRTQARDGVSSRHWSLANLH